MQSTSRERSKPDGKSNIGWKVGGAIAGLLSGASLLTGIAAYLASSKSDQNALLQCEGAFVGICLSVGLWKASKVCRLIWLGMLTLAAVAVAYKLGPNLERRFENAAVGLYLFALLGPVAWVVLLDRASNLRVIVSAVLVAAWHAAAAVVIRGLA